MEIIFFFDASFLEYSFDKWIPEKAKDTKWLLRKVDDLKVVARVVFPNTEYLSQEKLGNLLNIPNLKAHDAMGDVEQMLEIYCTLMKKNYKRILAHEKAMVCSEIN